MNDLCLVTGANGHLGNNLVRVLLKEGRKVRASVRNTENIEPFRGLNCEIVYADLRDRQSLASVLDGVDTLYQVAAVFKHWAKKPEKEIVVPNVEGSRNVMEVAAQKGVKKIVHVSSVAALDNSKIGLAPLTEEGWDATEYPYYKAKTEAEKLAWRLAKNHNLWMVSVLPSAMIGPNCFGHLTPTMALLNHVITNNLPADINFYFNFVDVRDVAKGMVLTEENGTNGERYILGGDTITSTAELVETARSIYPDVKKPRFKPSKGMLKFIALAVEMGAKLTGREPTILRKQVDLYYDKRPFLDISKARKYLGYDPRPVEEAIKEVFRYLKEEWNL